MPADHSENGAIRRGHGLRLSVGKPDSDEMAALAAPQGEIRRGQGLVLSTSAANGVPHTGMPFTPPDPSSSFDTVRVAQLASGSVRYRQAGQGRPLVLVHGWGASARYWLPTFTHMADTRRVIALDLPGFGGTPALDAPATVSGLAELVLELAAALELDQFDLGGHSFGASVAAVAASLAPGRVRRLALVSFGVLPDATARALLALARQPAALALGLWYPLLNITSGLRALARPCVTELLSAPPLPSLLESWFLNQAASDERLARAAVRDMAAMDLRAHLACLASIGDPAITAALGTVNAPTLVICGRSDRVTPVATAEVAARLIPGAELRVLERCGHVPMFEQPDAFHEALRGFLNAET